MRIYIYCTWDRELQKENRVVINFKGQKHKLFARIQAVNFKKIRRKDTLKLKEKEELLFGSKIKL